MAYDSAADRIVLFGGFDGTLTLNDTWAYDLNTNTWQKKSPSVSPSGHWLAGMAYDAQSDLIVLFGGGTTCCNDVGDTWVYNLNSNTWTQRSPSLAPSPRHAHAMAYDSESNRVVLYGGLRGSTPLFLNDTWSYDTDTDTWTQMNPVAGPPAMGELALAYDVRSDRVVEFGGVTSTGPLDKTWTYDVNSDTWANANPTVKPPARSHFPMAFDSRANRTILFGGSAAFGPSNDTWSFDLAGDVWTNQNPALRPSSRIGHRMAYDAESGRIVLFGGISDFGGVLNAETWAYDLGANTWTPLTLPSAPPTLVATAGDARVALSWDAPTATGGVPVTNYWIYRGTASGSLSALAEVGNVRTYTDTAVSNGITYFYAVSAVTMVGEGPVSSEMSATPAPAPDTTNPVVTITSPVDGATLTTPSVTAMGTASDNVGLSKVELSANGTNWTLATGTATWSATLTLLQGANTIRARATDTSGNTANATVTVSVAIPQSAPTAPSSEALSPILLGTVTAVVVGSIVAAVILWKRRGGRNGPQEPPVMDEVR